MKKVKLSKLNNELLQSQKLNNIQKQSIKGGIKTIYNETDGGPVLIKDGDPV